jgi:endoglucanase
MQRLVCGAVLAVCVALPVSASAGTIVPRRDSASEVVLRARAATTTVTQSITTGDTAPPACPQLPATRDPSNPLALATAPGGDPLTGAQFFVDGPTHGDAAGEIARLLGIDSSVPVGNYLSAFPDSESWQTFLDTTVKTKLPTVSPSVRREVELLEKIASEPEAQRISSGASGGSSAAITYFTNKLFCHNFTADPGGVPIVSTYFMHETLGGCPSTAQIDSYMPVFKQRVDATVQATGSRPVVYLLELDAIGSTACIRAHGSLPAWERMLRYEVDRMATLPHAVVYIEGGYADATTPDQAAQILNAVDIGRVRGFFTNDTHIDWTINEVKYGEAISRLTHGAHFVINTAQNGNGPKLNPHPASQGIEDLCNPPGRGLGPRPTTSTGFPGVDAFLWTHVPGNSSGRCNGGPASGTFWPARAIELAANANERLGPDDPSRPY